MLSLTDRVEGIPDSYYAQRIQKLVNDGLLVSQGNLSYMRFSEVRIQSGNEAYQKYSSFPTRNLGWTLRKRRTVPHNSIV